MWQTPSLAPSRAPTCQWLAPEKLRGCGALLLDAHGQRFVDELTTRDVVAAAVRSLPQHEAWLLLGSDGARAFGEGTLHFYASKGLLVQVSVHSSQGRNTLL